jgi:hypothetical protein
MLNGHVNVASSFFMVVMSNVRSRQLLVEICRAQAAAAAAAAVLSDGVVKCAQQVLAQICMHSDMLQR